MRSQCFSGTFKPVKNANCFLSLTGVLLYPPTGSGGVTGALGAADRWHGGVRRARGTDGFSDMN